MTTTRLVWEVSPGVPFWGSLQRDCRILGLDWGFPVYGNYLIDSLLWGLAIPKLAHGLLTVQSYDSQLRVTSIPLICVAVKEIKVSYHNGYVCNIYSD